VALHQRRLKLITFTLGVISFECQVKRWLLDPGIGDGERLFSFCPDGEDVEATDPEGTLELEFFSDWRSDGISDFLWNHSGETAAFQLDHHPDIPAEHVRWAGSVKLKAPPAGGDIRTTEMTSITLQVIGDVVSGYTRVGS
jgi:hypothetical protein